MKKDPHPQKSGFFALSFFWTFPLLFLLGFALSSHLSQLFYQLRSGMGGFDSICNLHAKMNCNQVIASPQAETFFQIPLSSLGAGWFLGLFFISLGLFSSLKQKILPLLFVCSSLGFLIGLPYLWIMAFQLKTFCLFCLLIDGIHLLSASMLAPLFFKPRPREPFSFPLLRNVSLLLIACMTLTVLGFRTLEEPQIPQLEIQKAVSSFLQTPPEAFDLPKDLPVLGNPKARLTIIEASDFECPHCQRSAKILKQVLNRYPQDVKVIFRNYPLSNRCNQKVGGDPHPFACEAAQVALCAYQMGPFEKAYELLFENQHLFPRVPQKSPLKLGLSLGLPEADLLRCIHSAQTQALLERDIQFGVDQAIRGTPQFWIGGRATGPMPFQLWSAILDELLKTTPPSPHD